MRLTKDKQVAKKKDIDLCGFAFALDMCMLILEGWVLIEHFNCMPSPKK